MVYHLEKNACIGVGIDIVDIDRFSDWHSKTESELARIFSAEEIVYCLASKEKSAERFAVRFAAREAFFKAFHSSYYTIYGEPAPHAFMQLCKQISIQKFPSGVPLCHVDWQALKPIPDKLLLHAEPSVQLSLSHSRTLATALVAITTGK